MFLGAKIGLIVLAVITAMGGWFIFQPPSKNFSFFIPQTENGIYVFDNITEQLSYCNTDAGCKTLTLPHANADHKANEKAIDKEAEKQKESPQKPKQKQPPRPVKRQPQEQTQETSADAGDEQPDNTPKQTRQQQKPIKNTPQGKTQRHSKQNDAIVSPIKPAEIPDDETPENDNEYASAVPDEN